MLRAPSRLARLLIETFSAGSVVASLTPQVAEEIWVVDDGRVAPWGGDILTYKTSLKKKKKSMS